METARTAAAADNPIEVIRTLKKNGDRKRA